MISDHVYKDTKLLITEKIRDVPHPEVDMLGQGFDMAEALKRRKDFNHHTQAFRLPSCLFVSTSRKAQSGLPYIWFHGICCGRISPRFGSTHA